MPHEKMPTSQWLPSGGFMCPGNLSFGGSTCQGFVFASDVFQKQENGKPEALTRVHSGEKGRKHHQIQLNHLNFNFLSNLLSIVPQKVLMTVGRMGKGTPCWAFSLTCRVRFLLPPLKRSTIWQWVGRNHSQLYSSCGQGRTSVIKMTK